MLDADAILYRSLAHVRSAASGVQTATAWKAHWASKCKADLNACAVNSQVPAQHSRLRLMQFRPGHMAFRHTERDSPGKCPEAMLGARRCA